MDYFVDKTKFEPPHSMVEGYKEQLIKQYEEDFKSKNQPLRKLNILDIGCGGGLLSEPFARLGANVTAIDAARKKKKTDKALKLYSKAYKKLFKAYKKDKNDIVC